MEKIKFIELMLSDFTTYHIEKENLLECNCIIEEMPIDCSQTEIGGMSDIPMIRSLLLVVDDYTKIISCDNEEDFDVNRKDISQILICYDNENVKMGYVNLSNDTYNENQINALSDNRLYITIEDE